jgi:hypothetical protein
MKALLFLLLPVICTAQVPRNAKTIIVKGVTFEQVCEQLLDKGYNIEKKDDQLQTVRTEAKKYPKYWDAAYKMDIRVKDSAAYITATYSSPFENTSPNQRSLFDNERVYNHTDKKGNPHVKSLSGYAFGLVNEFVLSFRKQVEYRVE